MPTVVISMLFVFTPYSSFNYVVRCLLIFVYNFGLQFFYNFFYDAYENLIHVLSPNSQERTNVTAIKSVIYSLSPTVTNFVTPLIAGKVAGGNMYDLRVYQWLYPFIAVIGVGLIFLVYSKTEEKIIVAKTQTMKVKFMDALREVAKNKYFWIISLAGWLGFLETCTYVILQWLYNYAHLCTAEQYSFITLIRGTAYGWGMIVAPFAIKRWGKKKVLIVTNLLNVGFLALVYPLMGSIWTVLICMYFNSVADSFILILNPAIQADIRDYQQYKSGERIDGMFGAVALIGSFVTMATSSVLPAVYEKYGIYSSNGYENMYDVLYDLPVLYKLIGVLVILSAVGAALNVVPYFFYDLTETKQKAIIRILQIRAMFEDYGNGVLTDDDMVAAMNIINDAKRNAAAGKTDVKRLKSEKASKAEIKAAKAQNEEYEIAEAILAELNCFDTPAAEERLKWASRILENGMDKIIDYDKAEIAAAKSLPKDTTEQRAIRKAAIADAKTAFRSQKAMAKYYPTGLVKFEQSDLDKLYEIENELTRKKVALLKAKAPKVEIKALTDEHKEIAKQIHEKTIESQRFSESTKVYSEAHNYLFRAKNYARFGELDAKYNDILN